MQSLKTAGKAALAAFAMACIIVAPTGAIAQQGDYRPPPPPPEPDHDAIDQLQLRQEAEDNLQAGVEALKNGDYDLAEQKFGSVLSYDPDNSMVNYLMGLAKAGNNDYNGASRYLKLAIRYDHDYVEARETLAMVSIQMDDVAEAQKQLDVLTDMRDKCAEKGCEDLPKMNLAVARVQSAVRNAAG